MLAGLAASGSRRTSLAGWQWPPSAARSTHAAAPLLQRNRREEDSQAGTAPPSPSVSQHGIGSQHSEPGLRVTADSSFGQLGKPEQAAWQHGALLK